MATVNSNHELEELMGILDGKVAIVTGASRGIGEATALKLAEEGASVMCAARSGTELEAVARKIRDQGGCAATSVVDVSDADAVAEMVRLTIDAFGQLDLAFNNAGTTAISLLADTTDEAFDNVIAVNLRGVFLCIKHQISAMGPGSAIVNVASVGGHRGAPFLSAYSASKHAVIGLSKSAAAEYAAQGIRINVLSPGPIETEMLAGPLGEDGMRAMAAKTPMQRIGAPAEAAAVAAFLLSDAASFMTGSTVIVDGGLTITHP